MSTLCPLSTLTQAHIINKPQMTYLSAGPVEAVVHIKCSHGDFLQGF